MLNVSKENSNYFCGFQTSDKYVKLLIKLFTNFTNYVPNHGIVPVLVLLHVAHLVLAKAAAFLMSSKMPPPPCILDLNSARPLPDGCAAPTHHFL
jgi:hypothetical protein